MTIPRQWPALRCDETRLPDTLVFERAVWGKLHGIATDFRWIAQTPAFGLGMSRIEAQLGLGSEDIPVSFTAWRTVENQCYAIAGYPSRSIDAAGRRGFLEKQILEWRRPTAVPAAMGALLLLHRVAASTDAAWWDAWSREHGNDSAVPLPISPDSPAPLERDGEAIRTVIAHGRRALRACVRFEALRRLYAQLLGGERPAVLTGLVQPLPPEALAVLLLPLSREEADSISIAGWLPASRPQFDELGRRWDVIVTAPAHSPPASRAAADGRASQLAERLLADDPEVFADEIDRDAIEAAIAVTHKPQRAPSSSRAVRTVERHPRPGLRLDLTPPEDRAGELLLEIYDFARSNDRRWLSLGDLKRHGMPRIAEDSPPALMLCDWPSQVQKQKPDYADPAQWNVKVDLLRAAALVLAPFPSTVKYVGLPDEKSRVPALFFAPLWVPREAADVFAALPMTNLEVLLIQSLTCGDGRWRKDLIEWLVSWKAAIGRRDLRTRIDTILNAPPRAAPEPRPAF